MRETYRSFLRDKISKNIEEYKKGRWKSIRQALAVSYSQANKRFPSKKSRSVKRRRTTSKPKRSRRKRTSKKSKRN